jgi:murein DD-endopeptidase MepM/ murein hydrolase activator NlpD
MVKRRKAIMKRVLTIITIALLGMLMTGDSASASAGPLDRHMAARLHVPQSVAGVNALFNNTTVTVRAGDTYGRWAITYCGTFNSWHAIQQANGWPERRIPVGAKARIVCVATAATPAPSAPAVTGWVHPLASGKHGTSCYGWRASTNSFHGGVDMPQPWGTTIRAASAGTVYRKGYERNGAGNYVVIRHAGNVFSYYMHMPSASPLALGAHVNAGQAIGRVGATGNATGPHLHFEIRLGNTRTNPATFMRNHGVNIGC